MITTLMNQKRGLTESVSCLTMEINAADGDRWEKQQTRSFGPNQLK